MPFELPRVREQLPGRRIEWYDSIDSTMTAAGRLAREGCAAGTIVGADEQTAGVGRHGHSWHSEPEAGLYVSLVLRLPLAADTLPLVMLALGLATQQAITQVTGFDTDLRWPNDVLLGGRKCAGILAQLEGGLVIAGIGINVSHARFPPEIADLATSLRLEGAAAVSREDLVVALIRAVDDCCRILTKEGAAAILKMFSRASSYAEGRRVRIEQEGAILEGVTCGLDPSGFLRLREENGKETTILAGGVRPV
jgi:BirA family biotin operon repressor/biotin-[acetyl-CoA-carboxylase] ligase